MLSGQNHIPSQNSIKHENQRLKLNAITTGDLLSFLDFLKREEPLNV